MKIEIPIVPTFFFWEFVYDLKFFLIFFKKKLFEYCELDCYCRESIENIREDEFLIRSH